MNNLQKPKKYWYSWRGGAAAFGARGLPIPIAPEGWYAIVVFILILVGAAFLLLPLHGNPTNSQLRPFIIVGVIDVLAFIAIGIFKQEPKPPKNP